MVARSILLILSVLTSLILIGCSQSHRPDASPAPMHSVSNCVTSESNTMERQPTSQPQEINGSPIITNITYVTNPNRELFLLDTMEEFGFYQLPYNSNELLLQFSQAMNAGAVEHVIQESLGSDVAVQFMWSDTQNLVLQISGNANEHIYTLDISGALDVYGNVVHAHPVLRFMFIEPKAFYAFDLESLSATLLLEPKMAIDGVRLSENKQFIHLIDRVGIFFNPYYASYLIDLSTYEWAYRKDPAYNNVQFDVKGYRPAYTYDVFFAEELPNATQSINVDFALNHPKAVLSSDGSQIAVFHTEQSIGTATEGSRYAVVLSIYDRASGQLLRQYPELYYDIFENDGTDAPPPERYFHYKEKYVYWFVEEQIVVEFLSEDEQEMLIGVLHLDSGEFIQIASQRIDPVLSPDGKHLVARIWNEEQLEILDVDGNVIDTLISSKMDAPLWSDIGDRLVYYSPAGDVMLYDMHSKSSVQIGTEMKVAGWLDEGRLLIYK